MQYWTTPNYMTVCVAYLEYQVTSTVVPKNPNEGFSPPQLLGNKDFTPPPIFWLHPQILCTCFVYISFGWSYQHSFQTPFDCNHCGNTTSELTSGLGNMVLLSQHYWNNGDKVVTTIITMLRYFLVSSACPFAILDFFYIMLLVCSLRPKLVWI